MNYTNDDYVNVCFNLQNLEEKLTKLMIENFILNPEISELTKQIKNLRAIKEQIKATLIKEEQENYGQ